MDLEIPGLSAIDPTDPDDLISATLPPHGPSITGGEFGGAPSPLDVTKLSRQELMNILNQAQSLNLDPRAMIGSKYILSIVPWPLQAGPFHHGDGLRYYSIPGVVKNSHYVLPIFNTFTSIQDTSRSAEEITSNGGRSFYVQRPISAQHLTDDLIKFWAGDHPANRDGGQLGVLQIRSKVPTPEELKTAAEMQAKFFRNLAGQAHKFHISGQPQQIHFEHYRAAEYLGLSPKEHPWVISQVNAEPLIACYSCKAPMSRDAYKCAVCREDNAQIFFEMQLAADRTTMPGIATRLKFLIDKWNKDHYVKSPLPGEFKPPVAAAPTPAPATPTQSTAPTTLPTPTTPAPPATGGLGLRK